MKQATVDHTKIIGTGIKWNDPDFNYTNNAVYWSDYNYQSLGSMNVNWGRARDRIPNASIFGTEISPNDVNQGSLGDCYFLASCSATAEFNSRFSRAFVTQTYPAEGIVVMRGRVLGVEKTIAVDDWFPFYTWSNSMLYFAKQSPSGGLWAPFLEKAWAKLNGNYEIVEGGWGHEVLRFITGAPTESYYKGWNWATVDEAWSVIS